jgi:hypothetical protein
MLDEACTCVRMLVAVSWRAIFVRRDSTGSHLAYTGDKGVRYCVEGKLKKDGNVKCNLFLFFNSWKCVVVLFYVFPLLFCSGKLKSLGFLR